MMKNYIFLILSLLIGPFRAFACDSEAKSTLAPASFTVQSPKNEIFTIKQWDNSSNQIGGMTIFENPEFLTIKDFLELSNSRAKDESRIFEWSTRDTDGKEVTKSVRLKGDQVFLSLNVNGEELSLVCSLKDLSTDIQEKEAFKSENFQSLLRFHNQIFNQYQPVKNKEEYKSTDFLWRWLGTNLGRRIATIVVISAATISNVYGIVGNATKVINEIRMEQVKTESSVRNEASTYNYTDYNRENADTLKNSAIPQQKVKTGYLVEMNTDALFNHLKDLEYERAEKAIEVHYDDFRMDPNFKILSHFHQNLVSQFLQGHQTDGVNKSRLCSTVLDYQEKGYQVSDLELKGQAVNSYDVAFKGAKMSAVNEANLNALSDENEALFKSIIASNPYVDQKDLLDQLLKLEAKDQGKSKTISGEGYVLTIGAESHIQAEGNRLNVSSQEKMEVEFKALYKPNYANPDQNVLQEIMEKGNLNEKSALTLSLHGGADSNSAALEYQNMEKYIQKNIQAVINGTVDDSNLSAFSHNLMKKNYSNVDFGSVQMKSILRNTLVNMILGSEETMSALAQQGISAEDVKTLDLKDAGKAIDGRTLDITGNAALTSVRIAVLDASFKALGLQNYKVLNNFLADGIEDIHSVIAANEKASSIIQKILDIDGKAKSIDDLSNDRILEILKDPLMQIQKNALFSQMRNSGISVTFNQTGVQTVTLKTLSVENFEQTFSKPNPDADVYIDVSSSMDRNDVSIFLNYLSDLGVKSIGKGGFHGFGEKVKAMEFTADKKAMTNRIMNSIRYDKLGDEENHYQLVKKEIGKYLNGTEKAPKTVFIATDEAIQGFSYKALMHIKQVIDSEHIPLDLKFLIINSNAKDPSQNYVKCLDLNSMVDLSLQMAFARGTSGFNLQMNSIMKSITDLEAKQSTAQGLSQADASQLKQLQEKFSKLSNLRLVKMYKLYQDYKSSNTKIAFSDVCMMAAFRNFNEGNAGRINYSLFHEQYKQVFGIFQQAA